MAKKISEIIIVAIIGLIGIICINNLYQRHVLKNDMPTFLGYGTGMILSGSMEPTLSINDLIITKKQNDYKVGDIIVFENNDILTTHRIIEKNNKNIITKGDANNAEDKPINKNAIKGKLVYTIKNANKKLDILKILIYTVIGIAITSSILMQKKED